MIFLWGWNGAEWKADSVQSGSDVVPVAAEPDEAAVDGRQTAESKCPENAADGKDMRVRAAGQVKKHAEVRCRQHGDIVCNSVCARRENWFAQ